MKMVMFPVSKNKYNILYAIQMREYGEEVNDKAKHHYGLKNIVVDDQEIPVTLKKSLPFSPQRAY